MALEGLLRYGGKNYMEIGILVFPDMDQMDFTGPFEVLARVPGAAVQVIWKDLAQMCWWCPEAAGSWGR